MVSWEETPMIVKMTFFYHAASMNHVFDLRKLDIREAHTYSIQITFHMEGNH